MKKKRIIVNYIYSSFYQLFLIIIPFITAPYMARVLLPKGIGINSFVSTVIQLFVLFGLIGLYGYSSREIAYVRENKEKLKKVFTELLIVRGIMALLTITCYIIYALNSEYSIYFLVQIPVIISSFIDVSWLYAGIENFKSIVIRSFVVKVINVATIFLFIKSSDDLLLFMCLSSFWILLGNIVLLIGVKKIIPKLEYKNLEVKKHFIPTLKLFLPQIATLVYLQADKIMIKNIVNKVEEVGFYEQAERIVKMPLALITALSGVMLPRISNIFKKNNIEEIKSYLLNSFQFSLFLAIPLMFGLIAISAGFIPWFLGNGYENVVPIMQCISFTVVFISLSSVSGNQYLVAVNNTKALTISYISAAIINLLLNYILINKLGTVGAAIGTVVAEIIVVVIQMSYIKNVISAKTLLKKAYKYLISGIFMFIICYFVGEFLNISIASTLIQIFIGVIVYVILLFVLKDDFFIKYFSLVKEKVFSKLKRS